MSNSNFRTIPVRAPDNAKDSRPMAVTSESFTDGATIPNAFVFTGCGGQNQSPQLSWSGVPNGVKSFAITCFDPDAPTGCGYWHWLTFNLPACVTSIVAGSGTDQSPAGGRSGYNDFGATAYAGPCPRREIQRIPMCSPCMRSTSSRLPPTKGPLARRSSSKCAGTCWRPVAFPGALVIDRMTSGHRLGQGAGRPRDSFGLS